MTANELIELFKQSCRRYHLIGTADCGVIAGLDLEGRLFMVVNGKVVSRVNRDAFINITDRSGYLNPGGDGLWPAPEGTCFGYEYATDQWRVPPGLTSAKYKVIENTAHGMLMEAEIDLINASGIGIPTVFRREVSIEKTSADLAVRVIESIEYIGLKTLTAEKCMLTPWSLAQFDCCHGCQVVFPDNPAVWDMYEPSCDYRWVDNGLHYAVTDGGARYQIGIGEQTEWIELHLPAMNLQIRRTAAPLNNEQHYVDIVDAPPDTLPSKKGVRYSVYTDTAGFMEIEAAGGCPDVYHPGTVMSVDILTEFRHCSL